ncbi:MAG: integrase core domain-containing protein, partial [Campylobacterales bacterium]
CERFNGSFRQELLDCYIFHSLSEVRQMAREWMEDFIDQGLMKHWVI